MSALIAGRAAWLAASTHPGEEEAVARAHEELGGKIPGLLTIVAPRHPERGAEIARKLDARGLACARRSLGEAVSDDTEVYVVDTLGELGLVYRLAPVAFVGGSSFPTEATTWRKPPASTAPSSAGRISTTSRVFPGASPRPRP